MVVCFYMMVRNREMFKKPFKNLRNLALKRKSVERIYEGKIVY